MSDIQDMAPARNDRNCKRRTQSRISPPPLKRQRTDPGNCGSGPSAHIENMTRSFPTLTRPLDPGHNGSSAHSSACTEDRGKPHGEKFAASFAGTSRRPGGLRSREDDESSRSSGAARSDRPNESGSSIRTCRACHKTISKGFDPLVLCTACQRPYHDACRKPPLAPGADPNSWNCLKCINSRPKSTSVVADLFPTERLPGIQKNKDDLHKLSPTLKSPHNILSSTKGSSTVTSLEIGRTDSLLRANRTPTRDRTRLTPSDIVSETTEDALDQLVTEAMQPKPKSGDPTGRTRRTEIPNTPDQRSSLLQIESTAPKPAYLQGSMPSSLQTTDDSASSIEQLQRGKKTAFTTICCICRKRIVLVCNNSKGAKCVKCKTKAEVPKVTIPETPVSMSSRVSSVEASGPASAVSSSHEGRSPASSLWFQSGLLNSQTKKIVAKEMRRCDISQAFKAQQHEPAQSQNPLRESRTPTESGALNHPETRPVSGRPAKDPGAAGETELLFSAGSGAVGERPSMNSALDTSTGGNTSNWEHRRNEHKVDNIEEEFETEGSEPALLQATADQHPKGTDTLQSPSFTVEGGLGHTRYRPRYGEYTNRQLAGMALLAADGGPCTAIQVQNWVANNCSGYRKGNGGWERSLQAILAGKSEFRAIKIPGDKFRRYTFADTASRKRFETLFSDNSAIKNSPAEHSVKEPLIRDETVVAQEIASSVQQQHTQRIESTQGTQGTQNTQCTQHTQITGCTQSTQHTQPPSPAQPASFADTSTDEPPNLTDVELHVDTPVNKPLGHAMIGCSSNVPIDESRPTNNVARTPGLGLLSISEENVSHDFDGVFMPFERAHMFRSIEIPDPPGIRRESSFFKAFPELAKSTIETMSDADIEKKIKEIENRPSRKAKWGKRLAFARRHRRDVHDERDGAWKPRVPFEIRDGDDVEGQGAREMQSLKDVFDLPKNPLLVLHNEQLAFRDGTLVNGRLPRSRVVYRVGRKFGGENGELRL